MTLSTKTLPTLFLFYALGCATVTVPDPEEEEVAGTGGVTTGDGDTSSGGIITGSSGGSPSGGSPGDGDGDVAGDGDGDLVGDGDGDLIGDGDGDLGTGGEMGTGGDAGTGGEAGTGGDTASGGMSAGPCPELDCASQGATTDISGTICVTVTIGMYGGWQISSDDGCSITIDGAPGMNSATLSAGQPHEIEVSGCSLAYAQLGCWY